jgi:predicted HicB family RNase H-like nuclease
MNKTRERRKRDKVPVNIALNATVREAAENFAARHGLSLSGLIEQLLREKTGLPTIVSQG